MKKATTHQNKQAKLNGFAEISQATPSKPEEQEKFTGTIAMGNADILDFEANGIFERDTLIRIIKTLANAPFIALNDLYHKTTDEKAKDEIKRYAEALKIEIK
ncbi:MAG: hypothetical protein NC131_00840 [Roseburia sp.]|nr:hypothetical protein [Roseburia sp.]